MGKGRLEAFSDGVIAIIITIMVLELKVPHDTELESLYPMVPIFLSYLMSFIFIGIYWNNHHHLFQLVKQVNGRILWANMHLLFWLSLIPFVTGWIGENHFEEWPVALYGIVLFFSGVAYYLLTLSLLSHHGKNSTLAMAIGTDFKGKVSLVVYAVGIGVSFSSPHLGIAFFAAVSVLWLIPDRRIENFIIQHKSNS